MEDYKIYALPDRCNVSHDAWESTLYIDLSYNSEDRQTILKFIRRGLSPELLHYLVIESNYDRIYFAEPKFT